MAELLERLQSVVAGRYHVEREIGRGGMATVFLALDDQVDREVAIKVLHPELSSTLGPDRFHREIQLAARLNHPNILGMYDSGEHDGLLYYSMPFIRGESLRARLDREGQLSVSEALHIGVEVADALGYAHEQGIVHRDIKPENILLADGHALVADFGIARALGAMPSEKLTQTGVALGTPAYMSPEQAAGDHVGVASDVYSLGCVIYEMLAGQGPFTGSNARAVMARHALDLVPRLQVVRDTIPDDIEDAVLKALAKHPADRYPTAAAFAAALRAARPTVTTEHMVMGGLSRVTSSYPAGMQRTIAGASPRRWWRWAVPAAAAVVAIGLGVAWWMRGRAVPAAAAGGPDPHRIAVLYFGDASADHHLGYLADGLTETLIRELTAVRSLDVISTGGVAPYRGTAVPRDSIARALAVGTLVQGEVEQVGDRVRVSVRLVDAASGVDFQRAAFERPGTELLGLRDSLSAEVGRLIRERLGEEIRLRQQRAGTQNLAAWSLLQRAGGLLKNADSLTKLGDTLAVQRTYTGADSLLALAVSLDPKWSEPAVLRGTIAYRRSRAALDDPTVAGKWIDRGLALVNPVLATQPNDPDALELRGDLRYWGWLMGVEPDPDKTKALLKDAQTDLEAAVKLTPSQAGAWATLSHLYYQTGTGVDVNLAARRAMEEDAYLSNADVILARLFFSSYDLAQFVDAKRWCQEGERRFTANPKFTECQLLLMGSRAEEPLASRAWALFDTLMARTPEPTRSYQKLNGQILVAAVLARAGLADSARHLVERSRGSADIDPTHDLANSAAFVYTLLGDRAAAVEQLKVYLMAQPQRRATYAADPGWWFHDLQDDPGFRRLVGDAP